MSTPTRIRPGIKALIVRDGKILLIKERVKRHGQTIVIHDFPGGGMELGETMLDTLHREVYEEIGLQVNPERVVGAWEFNLEPVDTDGVQCVTILCIGYQCSLRGHDKVDVSHNPAAEDIFAVTWLTPDEVVNIPGIAEAPGMVAAVRNLQL